MQFRWIDWNRDHIAEHGVDWEEAEMVVRQASPPYPQQVGDDKLLVLGQGRGGRFLHVIFVLDPDDTVFVIHARPLTDRREETLSAEKTTMSRKKPAKPYWEMTTEELREATKEFDEEFVADKASPLSPQMQAQWKRAEAKSPQENGAAEQTVSVRLDKALLDRCMTLAKKKRISRDALIARGLKAVLAAEGEI